MDRPHKNLECNMTTFFIIKWKFSWREANCCSLNNVCICCMVYKKWTPENIIGECNKRDGLFIMDKCAMLGMNNWDFWWSSRNTADDVKFLEEIVCTSSWPSFFYSQVSYGSYLMIMFMVNFFRETTSSSRLPLDSPILMIWCDMWFLCIVNMRASVWKLSNI